MADGCTIYEHPYRVTAFPGGRVVIKENGSEVWTGYIATPVLLLRLVGEDLLVNAQTALREFQG